MAPTSGRCAPTTEPRIIQPDQSDRIASGETPSGARQHDATAFLDPLLLLALLPAPGARAEELPVRKAGLWEMKMVRTGSPLPEMTMQHCTDETTDKEMSTAFSPMSKEICSKTRYPEDRDRLRQRFRVQRRRRCR